MDAGRLTHNPATSEAVPDLFIGRVSVGHNDRVVLGDRQSSSLLDCLGRHDVSRPSRTRWCEFCLARCPRSPADSGLASGFGVDVGLGGALEDLC